MNLNEVSFEEVKNYLYNCENDITRYLDNNNNANLRILINFAIEDMETCMAGGTERKLAEGDLDYVAVLTLRIIYLLLADKFEDTDRFAIMWAVLFMNYIQAFEHTYDKEDYLLALINLLQLKNNMARMIFLSDYIIDNKSKDNYLTVSQTYINTILEKEINCDPPKE